MKKVILASTSPRRKGIMDSLGVDYEIVPSNFEEDNTKYNDPYLLVQEFAKAKAKDVLERFPETIVIGSDTIVVDPNGKLMGKAKDREDAFSMMQQLQGKKSFVVTGLAVISAHKELVGYEKIDVTFLSMTVSDINAYLDDPEADWHDKAGAYAAQGKAGEWIEMFEGEWEALKGLPKALVRTYLREFGIIC